jgi:hypothetical protein
MATEHMKQLIPTEYSAYKNKYKSAFKQFDKFVELRILRKNHITNLGNGDIFFFSSSGSRHSENLKRILGTLEGRWLHKIFPNSRTHR